MLVLSLWAYSSLMLACFLILEPGGWIFADSGVHYLTGVCVIMKCRPVKLALN